MKPFTWHNFLLKATVSQRQRETVTARSSHTQLHRREREQVMSGCNYFSLNLHLCGLPVLFLYFILMLTAFDKWGSRCKLLQMWCVVICDEVRVSRTAWCIKALLLFWNCLVCMQHDKSSCVHVLLCLALVLLPTRHKHTYSQPFILCCWNNNVSRDPHPRWLHLWENMWTVFHDLPHFSIWDRRLHRLTAQGLHHLTGKKTLPPTAVTAVCSMK